MSKSLPRCAATWRRSSNASARHFDQVIDVHCVLTVEKLRQKAEATLHVSGNAIHADATEEDMYAAIDRLADKLDRCVKKHKEKRNAHRATPLPALKD